ncbi:MAG: hypothetical protein HN368_11285 [Spirochaetales bacterium]|jgi:hypothetical protein|nr:hypothetical protein [Spirochaetales bacterium]
MKLIIPLILIVILGGVAFYFGWIQLQLPENTYAVIFTKTGGWDEDVTSPGTFVWRWERLLPTNLSLHKFTLEPYSDTLSAKGVLPSAETYSEVLEPRPDFTFSLEVDVSFGIKPESLPKLAAEGRLTSETFEDWNEETSKIITSKIESIIRTLSTDSDFARSLTTLAGELTDEIVKRLSKAFPEVDIKALTIINIGVPDFELYLAAKEMYLELAKKRNESYAAALADISWTEARSQQHFTVLERYGELITEYPALLELISLKGGELGTILNDIDAYTPVGE